MGLVRCFGLRVFEFVLLGALEPCAQVADGCKTGPEAAALLAWLVLQVPLHPSGLSRYP